MVDDDLGSPTPKKASLLETASPTEWQADSARPLAPSEAECGRFWMEGREASSLADGRRSEGTTVGVIGRVSWDLRPGIILVLLFNVYARCQKASDVGTWFGTVDASSFVRVGVGVDCEAGVPLAVRRAKRAALQVNQADSWSIEGGRGGSALSTRHGDDDRAYFRSTDSGYEN